VIIKGMAENESSVSQEEFYDVLFYFIY